MEPQPLSPEQKRRVETFAPRVASIARTISRRVSHVAFDELQSAGYEGLVEAALRYDPASGVPFSAFAHYRVRGAMIDAARRASPAIRRRSRALRALQATQAVLEQAQAETGNQETVDRRTLRERVDAAAALVAQATTAVLISKLPPKDPDTLADSPSSDIEGAMLAAEQRALLERVLETCDEQERRLVEALYFEDISMHELAKQLGKSVSTVSRHHAKLLSRLADTMRVHVATNETAEGVGHSIFG